MTSTKLESLGALGVERLECLDPSLSTLLEREIDRQATTLSMVASSSLVDPSVLACQASAAVNVTAEGYPGARFHAGCAVIDEIEQLAIDRAKRAFGARYANVQPHSASTANEIVYFSLLQPGDTILGMQLDSGGHLTHGAKPAMSGKWFNAVQYGVREDTHLIDYDEVERMAIECKPTLIITGGSAYPRHIDFARFRAIADKVGALFMVDMAHFAGLVAAGVHPSPLPHAHVVTTTTHKTLRGPRGGMILARANEAITKKLQSLVFPGTQGGPLMHVIAAKAVALLEALQPEFNDYQKQILANARALAATMLARGHRIVSGGTDNHMFLLDLVGRDITGKDADAALGRANITVNKNAVPGDPRPPTITSGIRIGTPAVTTRGFREAEIRSVGGWIADVLDANGEEAVVRRTRQAVLELCRRFPVYGG